MSGQNTIISIALVMLSAISLISGAIYISKGNIILGNASMIIGFNFITALFICLYIKFLFKEKNKEK